MPRHANGTTFKPGNPGGPGRPKGVPNKATQEVKDLAQRFLDTHYWPSLEKRWREGKVQWPELGTLMAYGYGKPTERHELSSPNGGPLEMLHRIERVIVNAEDAEDRDA